MSRIFTVYRHTAPNGKAYIGITSQKPATRWQNGRGYSQNKLFYRAINKYGWESFTHEILFTGLCIETGKTYKTAVEAGIDTKCDSSSIRKVCKGEYAHTKGLHFAFAEQEITI